MLFWLFLRSTHKTYHDEDFQVYFKETIKGVFHNEILSTIGIVFFLLGLAFIFAFFNLVNIVLIVFSFLCVIHLINLKDSVKYLRKKEKLIISQYNFTPYMDNFAKVEILLK